MSPANAKGRLVRILAIDGGGMRGIIPARLLAHLEERTGRRIAELFELVAGTSTGGLLALGLSKPDPRHPAKPHYRASEIVDFYRRSGRDIFRRSLLHVIRSLGGWIGPKYPAKGLERTLQAYFGQARLHDALMPALVTSYDTAQADPYLFKSWRTREAGYRGPDPQDDFLMWQAARATAAAPTYFSPLLLRPLSPGEPKSLVDGGLFASNPAMSGLAEALRIHGCEGRPEARDFVVVSLGTGYNPRPESYETLRGRGRFGWAVPILDMVFDGASDSVDYQVGRVMGARYFRFQEEGVTAEMDDASEGTLEGLVRVAEATIAREEKRLDELARLLVSGAGRSLA